MAAPGSVTRDGGVGATTVPQQIPLGDARGCGGEAVAHVTAPTAKARGLQGDAAPSHRITTEASGGPVAAY